MNRDYDEQDKDLFGNIVSFFIGVIVGAIFTIGLTYLLVNL